MEDILAKTLVVLGLAGGTAFSILMITGMLSSIYTYIKEKCQ